VGRRSTGLERRNPEIINSSICGRYDGYRHSGHGRAMPSDTLIRAKGDRFRSLAATQLDGTLPPWALISAVSLPLLQCIAWLCFPEHLVPAIWVLVSKWGKVGARATDSGLRIWPSRRSARSRSYAAAKRFVVSFFSRLGVASTD
jgi:hypothetical protein